jgi:hypothetical protein
VICDEIKKRHGNFVMDQGISCSAFRGGTLPSAYSTSGSFCHRSVEDLNPVPGTPSLDHRLVRVNQDP